MNKGLPQTVAYCLPAQSTATGYCAKAASYTFVDAFQYGTHIDDVLQTLCQLMPNVLMVEPDTVSYQKSAELIRRVRMWPRLAVKCVVILPEMANWLGVFDSLDISGKVCAGYVQQELITCLDALANGYRFSSSFLHRPSREIPPSTPIKLADSLTGRECEVVNLVALGYTNQDIAQQLFISVKTVESHKCNVLQKLKLSSTSKLRQLIRRN